MQASGNTSSLLGALTIGVLLFGSVSLFLDARHSPGGSTMTLAGLLFAFALIRGALLYKDIQRKRRRRQQ